MLAQFKFKSLNTTLVGILFSLFLSDACLAQPEPTQVQGMLPERVATELERAKVPFGNAAFYVTEVESNKSARNGTESARLIFNAYKPMNPASTVKLVTTFAALDILGPTFTWRTGLYVDGPIRNGVLEGNLYIKGSGDPKLVTENVWMMLRQLQAKGVRDIRGSLILDRSAFDLGKTTDAAQFDGDPMRAYNAQPDALLINYNAITFNFVPNQVDGKVLINAEPRQSDWVVVNGVKLTSGDCNDWRSTIKADFTTTSMAQFAGTFSDRCEDKSLFVNASYLYPNDFTARTIRALWFELGGKITGASREGKTPPEARMVTEWTSPALAEVVRDVNKYSNNVMAKHVFLTLGRYQDKLKDMPQPAIEMNAFDANDSSLQATADPNNLRPARYDQSVRFIKTWLGKVNLNPNDIVLENGSGLSRVERISAANMARILKQAYQSPVMPEFISSLPLIGYDGTMKKRLNNDSVAGQAHIKTGSLRDVSAIAGYVLAESGKRYAVVGFINHDNAYAARPALDALLHWTYNDLAR